jgi:glycine/D-amino acid oxidase-like deaminating enzyme
VAAREGVDCGYAKGGALWFASDARQHGRLVRRFGMYRHYGLDDVYQLLGPAETTARVNATGVFGAVYTPGAAAVHPARLARGIARAVERLGGTIHEKTPALAIEPRRVVTATGAVAADIVVRATEAYTASLKGLERELTGLGNFVIATEPIPDALWAHIGLANRELFEDSPVFLAYGQRTADNRIVWGGCGAPYWFGSKPPPSPMRSPAFAERLRARLVKRFPVLKDIQVTHNWGGVMGMTRDQRSSVGYDRASGHAWIGGFGGAGVAPTNLAGRTLADLITGADTQLTRFPWANHRSAPWEPEPLRWLGVTTMLSRLHLTDTLDRWRG